MWEGQWWSEALESAENGRSIWWVSLVAWMGVGTSDGEFERLKLRGSKDKAERILFPAANAIGSAPFFSAYMWAAHLNFGGKEITSLLIRISRLLRYSSI